MMGVEMLLLTVRRSSLPLKLVICLVIKDLSAIIVGISYVWYLNCVINHVMLQLSFFFWIGMLHITKWVLTHGLNPLSN